MRQSDILAAVIKRAPDSFAPDGAPLMFVPVSKLRTLGQVRYQQVRKKTAAMFRKQREA